MKITLLHLAALGLIAAFTAIPLHAQTATQVWATRYSNKYDDVAWGTVVDGDGNVIVTGSVTDYDDDYGDTDIYTAKYAAVDGTLLWRRLYNDPSSGNDRGNAVAFDSANNVIVTGYANGIVEQGGNIGKDIYTAKYAAADGALLWEKLYVGAGNDEDDSLALTVDSRNGDVIIAGYAHNGIDTELYVAKYASSDGALLWEKHYNGQENRGAFASCVALDSTGNVIVTGGSASMTGFSIFYTAKYAASNGSLLWESHGPGYSGGATSLAVDREGNAIVTGTVFEDASGANGDYYTAKYSANDGTLVWEQRYNGPANMLEEPIRIAVDDAGNVAVTGSSQSAGGNNDYYTAKYAAHDGAIIWEQRGPEGSAASVAIDSAGNVVVTGSSDPTNTHSSFGYYTIKYAAANGAVLWDAYYDDLSFDNLHEPRSLALTSDGGVVVTGSAYATVRYTPPPATFTQWGLIRLRPGDDDDDPDHDGLKNILEYAMGTDPLRFTPAPVRHAIGGTLALTFPRITTATDVTLTVQGSDDLLTWTDLASSVNGADMVALVAGVTVNETGAGALRTVEVRDLYPIGDIAHPRRFLRLQAAPTAAGPMAAATPALKSHISPLRRHRRR